QKSAATPCDTRNPPSPARSRRPDPWFTLSSARTHSNASRPARQNFSFAPSTAQRLDKLHRGGQPLARKRRPAALRRQRLAVRVHPFEIAHDAAAITVCRKVRGTTCIRHRAILRRRLLSQVADSRKTVLHVAERHQNVLPINSHRLLVCGF